MPRDWRRGACRNQCRLRREEVDWLRGRYGFDIPRLESEQLDTLHQLALEIGIAELTGDHLTHRDLSARSNSQLQYQLAFE